MVKTMTDGLLRIWNKQFPLDYFFILLSFVLYLRDETFPSKNFVAHFSFGALLMLFSILEYELLPLFFFFFPASMEDL